MIQKPNLLKVNEYKVNDKISVHVPTVDEIFDFGRSPRGERGLKY